MNEYKIIILRERPELAPIAAEWFHCKWGVPTEAYLECMEAYLSGKTENGWWLCLYGENIVAGLGVIDNDFHDRKDLTPNVCAVYTEEEHRKKGLAGKLLNKVVDDMANKGVATLYLVTDHISYVLSCLKENSTQVRNIKQYLLAALYNAPLTISNYYQAMYNNDHANGLV